MLKAFRKKKTDNITPLAEGLNSGRYGYASHLFELFFYEGKEGQKRTAQVLAEFLSDISLKNWIKLSESMRGSAMPMPPDTNFYIRGTLTVDKIARKYYPLLTDGEYSALLRVGTFYRNGYIREACLRELSQFSGCLRYFYLCVNDRVREIRECAVSLLLEKLPRCDLYEIVSDTPILDKLRLTRRRSEAHMAKLTEIICGRLRSELTISELKRLILEEPSVRLPFYKFCTETAVLSNEHLEYLIEHEPFGNNKERLLMHRFSRFGSTEDEYERYIIHKCPNVRYTVLLHKYEALNDAWDGLETLLTDRSAKVRSLSVFILSKYRNFDARTFYLDILSENGSSIAVSDIGLYGTKADAEAVKGFITASGGTLAKKALHSYGRLMGSDGQDVYWEQLCSENTSMSAEAFRIISAYRIHYGTDRLYQGFMEHEGIPTAQYFVYLLCNEHGWDRIKPLLELYISDRVPDHVKGKVYSSITSRNSYTALTAEQADELSAIIAANRDKLFGIVDGLLFDISCARRNT